jgi:hypothetical protein
MPRRRRFATSATRSWGSSGGSLAWIGGAAQLLRAGRGSYSGPTRFSSPVLARRRRRDQPLDPPAARDTATGVAGRGRRRVASPTGSGSWRSELPASVVALRVLYAREDADPARDEWVIKWSGRGGRRKRRSGWCARTHEAMRSAVRRCRPHRDWVRRMLSTDAYLHRGRPRGEVEAQVNGARRVVGVFDCASGTQVGYARGLYKRHQRCLPRRRDRGPGSSWKRPREAADEGNDRRRPRRRGFCDVASPTSKDGCASSCQRARSRRPDAAREPVTCPKFLDPAVRGFAARSTDLTGVLGC